MSLYLYAIINTLGYRRKPFIAQSHRI
jgi:hypothetical protein